MEQVAAISRLLGALSSRAAHPAIVWGGRSYSFEEISRLSSLYSEKLGALGIRRGDRVAVFAETCPELIAAFIGHLMSGVIHVPINTRYKADEARHILVDSGAVAVLVGDEGEECTGVLREILRVSAPPHLRHVVALADALPSSPSKQIFSSSSPPSDEDIAMLIYTSGTTGKSKGVALSYRALADNTASVTGLWRFAPEDRLVLALPLFHVHGLVLGVTGMLVNGLTLLLEPRFDPSRVVRAFADEGATVFMGVPTMYVRLLEHLDAHPDAADAAAQGAPLHRGQRSPARSRLRGVPRENGTRDPRALRDERDALHAVEPVRRRTPPRHRRPARRPAARCGSSTTKDATRPTASSARSS